MPRARDILTSARARVVDAWSRVSAEDRQRLGRHAIAVGVAALSTLLAQALGTNPAGSLYFADFVIAVVAWEYGLSTGSVAALTALLAGRVAAVALAGAPMSLWLTAALGAKGLLIAAVAAALAARRRVNLAELSDLVNRNLSLQEAARRRAAEFSELAATSADEHATLRREADAARLQLTTLQSVTDPALNALDAAELLTTLLERMRVALNADGVGLYHFGNPGGRVCSAPSGVRPLGGGARSQPESRGYQTGRTALRAQRRRARRRYEPVSVASVGDVADSGADRARRAAAARRGGGKPPGATLDRMGAGSDPGRRRAGGGAAPAPPVRGRGLTGRPGGRAWQVRRARPVPHSDRPARLARSAFGACL